MFKKIGFFYVWKQFYYGFSSLTKLEKYRFYFGFLVLFGGCLLSALVQILFKNVINILTAEVNSIWYIGCLALLVTYSVFWTINQISNIITWLILQPLLAKISEHILLKLFLHMLHIDYYFFLTKEAKYINSYFETIYNTMSQILSHLIIHIIPSLIEMFIVFILFFYIYGYFYSGILILLLLLFFYFTYNSIMNSRKLDVQYYTHIDKFHMHIYQSVAQIEVIKTYGAYDFEYNKMKLLLTDFFGIAIKRTLQLDRAQAFQIIACGFILLLLSVFSFFSLFYNKISLGDFVMLNNYFIQFTIPITFLGYIFAELYKNFILLKKSFLVLDKKEDQESNLILFRHKFISRIVFENVSLSFDDKKVLNNVSFEIKEKQKVAIVGGSGSGKSSCLKLLMKLYKANTGNIFISDQNIANVASQELYHYMTIVSQNNYIFGGTVRENICYNTTGVSDDTIIDLLKKLRLYEKIQSLEKGLDTRLENIDFSGGEKQRIGIARALVRDPAIFLFDEITAALDTQTETDIKNYLDELLINKTAIFVTHRLLFAKKADMIIVLKQGKIKAQGAHDELMEKSIDYQKLYQDECEL
jgi:ABC-type multidrug transport system fused ATPase/permease subunit